MDELLRHGIPSDVMEPLTYVVLCGVAFGASLLTFFTGFGLGTLLLPAFAAFFPPQAAIALTAVVHLLNSLFKLMLVGWNANRSVVLRFGLPAVAAAFAGALVLGWLAGLPPLFRYELAGETREVVPVAFVVAALMVVFAALELWPKTRRISIAPRFLPLGGLLTGFFGGLSGHQGALRSAFLLRLGLTKETFIATGAVIAALVDVARLAVYTERFFAADLARNGPLLGAAGLAAFAGAFLGNRLVQKVTLRSIEIGVAVLLILVALGLGSGLI
jgi:uncharacterized membrane protein YfcA